MIERWCQNPSEEGKPVRRQASLPCYSNCTFLTFKMFLMILKSWMEGRQEENVDKVTCISLVGNLEGNFGQTNQ